MTYSSVNTMLKNRRLLRNCLFETSLPDAIPAIVPKDLFDWVQAYG